MIRIGFLGIAHMHGYSYLSQLKAIKDVQISGIYDHDSDRASVAAEKFGIEKFDEALELVKTSDAVVITAENTKHREYAELAAVNGKHILCEKPIATTEEDAQAMIKAARDNNVVFQMAFPVRYAPSIQQAKQVLDSGKVGKILSVTATNHGRMPGGWFVQPELSGGGAVMDHTVHVVDIIRWLLNVEVEEVSGYYDRMIYDIPVEDCGLLMLKLSSGAFMTLDCSWSRPAAHPYWGDVTLRLVGTEGTLWIDAFDAKIRVYSNEKGVSWSNYGDNFDEALVKEFLSCIKENREPLTNANDGLEALRVPLAAYNSKASGRKITIER